MRKLSRLIQTLSQHNSGKHLPALVKRGKQSKKKVHAFPIKSQLSQVAFRPTFKKQPSDCSGVLAFSPGKLRFL